MLTSVVLWLSDSKNIIDQFKKRKVPQRLMIFQFIEKIKEEFGKWKLFIVVAT